MTRHPLDPADEVRKCRTCGGKGFLNLHTTGPVSSSASCSRCTGCNGTGKQGNPDAELVIEVYPSNDGRWLASRWNKTFQRWNILPVGPKDTHAESLRAARCAVLGIEVSEWFTADKQRCSVGWFWSEPSSNTLFGDNDSPTTAKAFNDPDAAISAACRARREET